MRTFAFGGLVNSCAAFIIYLSLLIPTVVHAQAIVVSPSGNDNNPGTEAAPILTLTEAQKRVRAFRASGGLANSSFTVLIRAGTYYLTSPLIFGPDSAGTAAHSVIFQNYPGERPVISGAMPITNWTAYGDGSYGASVPAGALFRRLYSSDFSSRPIRARFPNADAPYFLLKSYNIADGTTGGIELFESPQMNVGFAPFLNSEMVILKSAGQSRLNIEKAYYNSAVLFKPKPIDAWREANNWSVNLATPAITEAPYRVYFENSPAFLDQTAEWFQYRTANLIRYIPTTQDKAMFPNLTMYAPRLDTLIKIQGTPTAPVIGLSFYGLEFRHTGWNDPSFNSYIGTQNGHCKYAVYGCVMPGAIEIEYAQKIQFIISRLAQLGGKGLVLRDGTKNVDIVGNIFYDVAGNGISIDTENGYPTNAEKSSHHYIADNFLTSIGTEFDGTGIFVGFASDTSLLRNSIQDVSYSGIAFGWGWSETWPYHSAFINNVIAYNNISRVTTKYSDGGGIYTLPGTGATVDSSGNPVSPEGNYMNIYLNYIHDIQPLNPKGFQQAGIYLDHLSNGVLVQQNYISQVPRGVFLQDSPGFEARYCYVWANGFNEVPTHYMGPDKAAILKINIGTNSNTNSSAIIDGAKPLQWVRSYWGI